MSQFIIAPSSEIAAAPAGAQEESTGTSSSSPTSRGVPPPSDPESWRQRISALHLGTASPDVLAAIRRKTERKKLLQ